MVITLTAKSRKDGESVAALRSAGEIPAVVYGKGRPTASISVPMREFMKVLKEAGESSAVSLVLPDGTADVLIHEVVNSPVRGIPEHVDFLVIDMKKPIEVSVPIEFTGVAPAEKGGLGVLVKVMHEIEVKGLPKNVPHTIEVDISSLDVVGAHITIADLKLPAGVEAMVKPEDIVANVSSIKEEKEEVAAPIDFTQIEVEKKGKKDEEGDAEKSE